MKFSIYFCLILTFGQLQKNVTTCPFRRVAKIIHLRIGFFFCLGFLSRTFTIHSTVREGEDIYLIPLYHFHPLHRNLNISRVIIAESSSLHIARIVAGLEPGTFDFRAQVDNHYGTRPLSGTFKDNICSIGMLCVVAWFRRSHLQKQPPEMLLKIVVLKDSAKFTGKQLCWRHFPCSSFVPCGVIWLGQIHQLTSVDRLL